MTQAAFAATVQASKKFQVKQMARLAPKHSHVEVSAIAAGRHEVVGIEPGG